MHRSLKGHDLFMRQLSILQYTIAYFFRYRKTKKMLVKRNELIATQHIKIKKLKKEKEQILQIVMKQNNNCQNLMVSHQELCDKYEGLLLGNRLMTS